VSSSEFTERRKVTKESDIHALAEKRLARKPFGAAKDSFVNYQSFSIERELIRFVVVEQKIYSNGDLRK